MKKLIILFAAVAVIMSGCTTFDDSALQDRVDRVESQIQKLETLCSQMNTNLSSLQAIVDAAQNQDCIIKITPLIKDGVEIGYTISFAKHSPVIIYHSAGIAGETPIIGVRKASDGLYYWTVDGEWLLDSSGKKIIAQGVDGEGLSDGKNGITPQVKIEDGYWFVSYDEGVNWERLGEASGKDNESGDAFFREVSEKDGDVTFVLADGTEIVIPLLPPLDMTFDESGLVVMGINSSRTLSYEITGQSGDLMIEVLTSGDVKAVVQTDGGPNGELQIQMGGIIDEYTKIIVLVSDGLRTIARTLYFEEAAIEVEDSSIKKAVYTGGEVRLEYMSNTACEVIIPHDATWIKLVSTKAMDRHEVVLKLEENKGATRSADIILKSDSGIEMIYTVTQRGTPKEEQREVLMELYEMTNGSAWTDNTNWGTDSPINTWYGVECDSKGMVTRLNLQNNGLFGDFPGCLGRLDGLETLFIGGNSLMGPIPDEFFELKKIEVLDLRGNLLNCEISPKIGNLKSLTYLCMEMSGLKGPIPSSIGNLVNVRELYLESNNLTGSIPPELAKIMDAEQIWLSFNKLSGKLPKEIAEHPRWAVHWPGFLKQSGTESIDYSGVFIPAPEFRTKDIDGKMIDSEELYSEGKYTIFYRMSWWYAPAVQYMKEMANDYETLQANGINVLGVADTWDEDHVLENYANDNIPWTTILYNMYLNQNWVPFAMVVDNAKREVVKAMVGATADSNDEVMAFIDDLAQIRANMYESSDYSRDGQVTVLQKASKGAGIDIVMMGDAYSDRLIADGTYSKAINRAVEQFFSEEPFKTYRDYFNIYQVDVVSPNEIYKDYSTTALNTQFGGDTYVYGDDYKAFEYAQKAITIEEMNEALIVVLMNRDAYAGTCFMYNPIDRNKETDYASGTSIAYFPTSSNEETMRGLMIHEAGGHGFANLADEYAYESMGRIPQDGIDFYEEQMVWGWWKNVAFTSDPTKVRWANYITDPRYADEGIGVFEGGLTYWSGVWRPTEFSNMRYNEGGFNAPSREAIYYRIHKLAYGEDWQYDHEEFVKYDEINRSKATKSDVPVYLERPKDFVPTAPPVVRNYSWKEAKSNK